jgi:hypothetical protein
VGLARMRCQGRQKLCRTNAEAIRPLHEWAFNEKDCLEGPFPIGG